MNNDDAIIDCKCILLLFINYLVMQYNNAYNTIRKIEKK